MSINEMRAKVKQTYPHVKISVKTVSFSGFGYGSAKFLTVAGDRSLEELKQCNEWAQEAGVKPDSSLRFYK
jgi:hypothetical protein